MFWFDGVAEFGVLVGPDDGEDEAGEEVVDDCMRLGVVDCGEECAKCAKYLWG
jgi:hypothetical protein